MAGGGNDLQEMGPHLDALAAPQHHHLVDAVVLFSMAKTPLPGFEKPT
jgi:hypothetical protein